MKKILVFALLFLAFMSCSCTINKYYQGEDDVYYRAPTTVDTSYVSNIVTPITIQYNFNDYNPYTSWRYYNPYEFNMMPFYSNWYYRFGHGYTYRYYPLYNWDWMWNYPYAHYFPYYRNHHNHYKYGHRNVNHYNLGIQVQHSEKPIRYSSPQNNVRRNPTEYTTPKYRINERNVVPREKSQPTRIYNNQRNTNERTIPERNSFNNNHDYQRNTYSEPRNSGVRSAPTPRESSPTQSPRRR